MGACHCAYLREGYAEANVGSTELERLPDLLDLSKERSLKAELFGVATKALAARSIAGENAVGAGVSRSRESNDRQTDYFN